MASVLGRVQASALGRPFHDLGGTNRTHRAGLEARAPGDALDIPFALLVGLGTAQPNAKTVLRLLEILDVERDQLRAAEAAGETEQEKSAIPPAAERVVG